MTNSTWENRWPPERRIAYIRDEMSEAYVEMMFETIMLEDGGEA
jgi:hypothetical protein